jgi:hypothetical protein
MDIITLAIGKSAVAFTRMIIEPVVAVCPGAVVARTKIRTARVLAVECAKVFIGRSCGR